MHLPYTRIKKSSLGYSQYINSVKLHNKYYSLWSKTIALISSNSSAKQLILDGLRRKYTIFICESRLTRKYAFLK